jgi:hypothetical protein
MWQELYYIQHTNFLSKGPKIEDMNVGYVTKLLLIPKIRRLETITITKSNRDIKLFQLMNSLHPLSSLGPLPDKTTQFCCD